MKKNYDSICWQILFYMLGFKEKWIKWIKSCLTTSMVFVLVNGSPSSEFGMQQGLRQGDPLAHFLYVVVAERLSGLMREAVSKNLFASYLVGKNKV